MQTRFARGLESDSERVAAKLRWLPMPLSSMLAEMLQLNRSDH